MEQEALGGAEEGHWYSNWGIMSPEIVEIGEESNSMISKDGGIGDVYVAVGKNDMDVVKWAIDHAVSPGGRVFLVHVFPSITYIPTPVGRLSRSQLTAEQVQVYINEEFNRRRHLLQKYIRLCADAKVTVDTMLLESNAAAKAILDLIPVVNITNLVMGTKRPPSSRRMRRVGKGEFVQKNAPDYCEVTIVHDGEKITDSLQQVVRDSDPAVAKGRTRYKKSETAQKSESNVYCPCFPSKFYR